MKLGIGLGRLWKRTPLPWYLPNQLSRVDIIQRAIDALGAKRYLEIGVSVGDCFSGVRVAEKIGVDPIEPQPAVAAILSQPGVSYYPMTSNDFFATAAPAALAPGIDVAFVDGLHTDRQAYVDCLNALRYLRPGGLVLMHDNLPRSAMEASPVGSYEEAWRVAAAGWDGHWTGDAWKAIVRLRALHPELSACVLNCDHGVAAVWRAPQSRVLSCTSADIDAMTYDDLAEDPSRLLGLRSPDGLADILEACRARRGRS